MNTTPATEQALLAENAELRARLEAAEEAQETLRAIYSGEVDALVIQSPKGPRLFTLQGADAESNRFRGEILAQVSDAVIAVDTELRVTYLNAAAERQYGVTASEALGRCLDELYQFRWLRPEDAAASAAALRETGHWRGENIHIKRNGEAIQVESSVSCLLANDGTQTGLLAVIRDVTERKRAEEALRQQADLLDKISDAVISTDADFRIQTWNRAAERIYGWKAEEALGKEADSLLRTDFIVPGSREEAVDQLMATGFAQTETRHRDRHGRELIMRGNVTLLKNAQGEVTGTLGVLRDVTERKRAEEALRRSEALYRAIGESIDYGVWVCDAHGRNTYASESFLKLVGITQEQCSNFGWGDVLHPDDAERTLAAWKECSRTGGIWDIEHRFRRVDGEYRPILARGVPIRNEHGEIVSWAGINLDISRLKRAEQALKEAHAQLADHTENLEKTVARRTAELRVRTAERERLQQELLKISEREKLVISQELHDGLCQNLAGTAMMVSILARGLATRGDKDAESAKQICALLNSSVHEARNLSHGLHPVGPEGEGLMNALADLAGTVANLFHIRCIFSCPKPVILENGAASTHLFRIVQEAINNARKHGEADEVKISLSNTAKGVVLTIRDNGVGIPSDLSRKRGMGLKSMGYRAAEIGATLSVRRGARKGTVVSCSLPTRESAR